MKFNEKLKALRNSKNMTQDNLAEKLHVTRQSVSKWEQGLSEPNLETLKELCKIFDISISDLVDDDNKITTTKEERQFKTLYKLFIINGAFLIFGILLTAVLIKMMPKSIPMHWDLNGNITRYGSKWGTLFFMGFFLFFFGNSAFIHFYYSKRRREFTSGLIPIQTVLIISQFAAVICYIWMAFSNVGDISIITPAITGILIALFMVLSLFSAPLFNKKRNAIFGFRTHFTLTNNTAWEKVNAFQSISALICSSIGFIIVLITFKKWNFFLISLILISMIPTLIYHEILRKTMKR